MYIFMAMKASWVFVRVFGYRGKGIKVIVCVGSWIAFLTYGRCWSGLTG